MLLELCVLDDLVIGCLDEDEPTLKDQSFKMRLVFSIHPLLDYFLRFHVLKFLPQNDNYLWVQFMLNE